MEYPLSEIVDRLSIVMLKRERISKDIFDREYKVLYSEYSHALSNYSLSDSLCLLYEINGNIWDLEADIRSGKEGKIGLEEVGRRAIEIRNLNKKRVVIKNEITKITGSGFNETKGNHASE